MDFNFSDSNCRDNKNNDVSTQQLADSALVSKKSKTIALLLCFFFGGLGLHQFYVGKTKVGFLYVFTLGFFGIAQLVDLVKLCTNKFIDSEGAVVKRWELD